MFACVRVSVCDVRLRQNKEKPDEERKSKTKTPPGPEGGGGGGSLWAVQSLFVSRFSPILDFPLLR